MHNLPNLSPAAANSGEALGQYFPELAASPDALSKWWTLALTRLATADSYQMFTPQETERRLQTLLTFPGPTVSKGDAEPAACTLADFEKFTPLKQNARILDGLRKGLLLLSAQAGPFYQPIVLGYREVVEALIRNHTKGVSERLRSLEAARHDALKRREEIADYVNWYEATQMPTQSNAFNNYFHTSHQLDGRQKIHRPDAISAYLDSLDTEFQ